MGRADQVRLVSKPNEYLNFVVRNLAANGEVWTGEGENTRRYFPELQVLQQQDYPTENMCSMAIRRVAPGGGAFRVIIRDNADDTARVKSVFGPYPCS